LRRSRVDWGASREKESETLARWAREVGGNGMTE
jgi:hypothetical protein